MNQPPPASSSDAGVKKNKEPPVAVKSRSDSLFGSTTPPPDEGLLFGAPPTKPPPTATPTNNLTTSRDRVKSKKATTEGTKVNGAPPKPKEKLGGLFDDDESDDDLFASSKKTPSKPQVEDLFSAAPVATKPSNKRPKPVAKPAKQVKQEPSDLFGSPPTSDPLGGDLFTQSKAEKATHRKLKAEQSLPIPNEAAPGQTDDLLTSSLSPQTLPKKSAPQQSKPSDTNLFDTSDSHKNDDPLFPNNPPPASTKVQSPSSEGGTVTVAPTKKKPAGAVSLFGGVDLLGDKHTHTHTSLQYPPHLFLLSPGASGLFGQSTREDALPPTSLPVTGTKKPQVSLLLQYSCSFKALEQG